MFTVSEGLTHCSSITDNNLYIVTVKHTYIIFNFNMQMIYYTLWNMRVYYTLFSIRETNYLSKLNTKTYLSSMRVYWNRNVIIR